MSSIVFKYFDTQWFHYLNEIWQKQPESSLSLRKVNHKLVLSFRKSNAGQNVLFFIGPALHNKIPEKMKKKTQLISRKTKKP